MTAGVDWHVPVLTLVLVAVVQVGRAMAAEMRASRDAAAVGREPARARAVPTSDAVPAPQIDICDTVAAAWATAPGGGEDPDELARHRELDRAAADGRTDLLVDALDHGSAADRRCARSLLRSASVGTHGWMPPTAPDPPGTPDELVLVFLAVLRAWAGPPSPLPGSRGEGSSRDAASWEWELRQLRAVSRGEPDAYEQSTVMLLALTESSRSGDFADILEPWVALLAALPLVTHLSFAGWVEIDRHAELVELSTAPPPALAPAAWQDWWDALDRHLVDGLPKEDPWYAGRLRVLGAAARRMAGPEPVVTGEQAWLRRIAAFAPGGAADPWDG